MSAMCAVFSLMKRKTRAIMLNAQIEYPCLLSPPHTQLHSPPLLINLQNPHLHYLANRYHRQRISHITVRQFRNMYQAILLDANIHESAKVNYVTNRTL